ncbi:hypothetical protein DBR00_02555 [Pseudomonas sp. HMWF032]|uniref:hypothetical protein n=1 Tax=Pseudomonas sp. HMWF032 TaxID=2056866 RepID=UPI000D35B1A1|nr:hypothetical protein [Pseudomonas sp. HMWF032]PTS86456.1 hypothetical protein DBR00_02555 [Pseudomonas sp. HMWF032]PTT81355.1 hypothetical protein DBR41_16975 [Pseudomonas sp. HMWF010]
MELIQGGKPDPLFCVNCVHHKSYTSDGHKCYRSRVETLSLVTGKKEPTGEIFQCKDQRVGLHASSGRCGTKGHFFKPKE